MNEREQTEFKKERHLATLLVLSKLPNFFIYLFAGIASSSLVVWMEFVETASIIIPGALLAILSTKLNKNLKYQFNYGTGKVEAITALSCEIFDIAGLICIVILSIRELFRGGDRDDSLLLAIILVIVGAAIDYYILTRQKKLIETRHSRMLHTAYISARKEFWFDLISLATLIITFLFSKTKWVDLLSPILCIISAIPFLLLIIRHIRAAVNELIDLTLDEESQLKLLRVLAKYYEEYEAIGDIRSRQNGEITHVEIELTFHPDKTYREIKETVKHIKDGINKEFDHCQVNIVIS